MKTPRILLVDDQQTNINLLRTQFRDYEISEANSGRIALRKVAEDRPDVVIMDVMMPGLDGYSVLSILKHSPNTRGIPVILLTALGGTDEKLRSLELGADDFITKPVNPQELQIKVKALLRIKGLYDELAEAHRMLLTLSDILEKRSPWFRGHSQRVAYLAMRLARKELLQPWQQEEIRLAAQLHDIGLCAIPDSILLKPDTLTEDELQFIHNHPVVSEQLCLPFTALRPLLPFIRHHHEHFDGSGYPDGLKGTDIPLGARIIAIAEAFDALTHDRPYRKAFSPDTAIDILRKSAEIHWDPRLVELFSSLPAEDLLSDPPLEELTQPIQAEKNP